jgi:hypothetical protein
MAHDDTWTEEYDEHDAQGLDPINLPEDGTLDLALYQRLVLADLAQPPEVESATHELPSSPGPAMGDNTAHMMMLKLFERMVAQEEARDSRRQTLSQKDAAEMLSAVPSIAPNGVVLSGPKLLSWFQQIDTTYLEQVYWGTSYAFNATQKLFADAPDLLATWKQVTQSDEQVVKLKREGKWKEAFDLVAEAMISAHTGDRHAHHRKTLKPRSELVQGGSKTVAETVTALLEDQQARQVFGLWDGIGTLIHDLEENAAAEPMISLFGFDLRDKKEKALHDNILSVLAKYRDCSRAPELYGALRTAIQTHIEDEIGDDLLAHTSELEKVRSLAVRYEVRERNQEKDMARRLRSLGLPVKRVLKARASTTPGMARQTAVIQAGSQLSDDEEEVDDRWRAALDELSPDDRDHLENEAEGAPDEAKLEMLHRVEQILDERILDRAVEVTESPKDTAPLDLEALKEVLLQSSMKEAYQQAAQKNASRLDAKVKPFYPRR